MYINPWISLLGKVNSPPVSKTLGVFEEFYAMHTHAFLTLIMAAAPLSLAAITCLKVGSTATATWTNAAGRSCRWNGVVGSNFGRNAVNGGEYVLLDLLT